MKRRFSLRIDKEGRWFSNGEEITHRKTYLLYSRNLTWDESGLLILRIGREQWPVEVEDAPYVVKSLRFMPGTEDGGTWIDLFLNDETCEPLNPESLRIGRDNVPYCRVHGGRFDARFSSNAYQILIPAIQYDEPKERFFLLLGGKEYDLVQDRDPMKKFHVA